MSPNHIIIFSHGFGVYADDRGLFPNIIKSLEAIHPIMFDYNQREVSLSFLPNYPRWR